MGTTRRRDATSSDRGLEGDAGGAGERRGETATADRPGPVVEAAASPEA